MRITLAVFVVFAACFCGCAPVWPVDAPSAESFLAVNVSSYGSPEALPVVGDSVVSAASEVALPTELISASGDPLTLRLSAPQLDLEGGTSAGRTNPRSEDGGFHATITFHLAARGESACGSDITVGPYQIEMIDGETVVHDAEIVLGDAAADLVRSGQFEICAEIIGDFDGALSVSELLLEFGQLHPDDTKVELCHVPPGNPNARHTIIVGSSAVPAHLNNGSYLGPCQEVIKSLKLTSMCSNDPTVTRRWRVRNSNDVTLEVSWEVYGTGQSGYHTAPPGDSFFETSTVGGPNTTIIRWLDHNGVSRSTVKASGGAQCPPDSDGDGVPDASDQCPGTPAGTETDDTGCPLVQDLDGDGVNDDADTCPNTPAGETADTAGCSCSQSDADGDGVNNCTDACPDTAAGETVDADGCACGQLDSDGDGVNNCDDGCPSTPAGEAVDAGGCSCSQADADGDGVNNCDDACADTPVDEPADATGCSCTQLDEDGDGLNDCDDFCPGTPAGATVDALGCEIMVADAGEDITLSDVGPVTLRGGASGGSEPYTYTWSAEGWAGSQEQNPTVMPSTTTVYTLVVTDWSFPPRTAIDTVTVTITPPPAQMQYAVTDLGSLSTKNTYGNALNDIGQVVGTYTSETYAKRAFLWQGGVMTDIGTLGGADAEPLDINNAGVVVGRSKNAAGQMRAFMWDAVGGMRDLGTLGGSTSEAYAINESGQVAGYSLTADGYVRAFVYSGGAMTALDITGYSQSGAFDINSHGESAGILLPASGNAVAFVHDGTLHNLGSPLLTASEAWLINDEGVIAGHSWGGGEYRSFLYWQGAVVDLGVLDGFAKTYAWGLSPKGQVVGSVANNTGIPLSHAFIFSGGTLQDLNDLLEAGHGWDHLTLANDINIDGQIVGYGKINGLYRAFLATPQQ